MAVYVDNMMAGYGRMKMCHMMADSEEELHKMADKIGVARRWHQKPGLYTSHYDVCMSKRKAAIAAGAKAITTREAASLLLKKRKLMLGK